ncbi:amonabactin ABC transporter substrate-binding protein [Pseudomonas sp. 3A(2025)]
MFKPLSLVMLAVLATPLMAAERTLDTAFGPVKLDATPQRVITLDEGSLDTALALGIQPVGTVSTRGSDQVSAYLKDKAGTPGIVGTSRAPNMEAIFKLKPDLILAPEGLSKDLYAAYSRIAPTIVAKGSSSSAWQDNASFIAKALDREAQGKSVLQAIDQRIAALKAKAPAGQTVSVVRWNPQGPIAMSSKIFVGQLLTAAGFKSTELANSLSKPHSDVLSLENLSKIDADWLFVASLNSEGAKTLETARAQPAFARLGAVQNKQVVDVDGQVWASGSGPLAANKVLDDLEKALIKP